ncbi:maleylacetoacetate isomerase-like [Ornithodoros turicata]|uniref:maleylacetoacetate isomerase-like n=1 Tax=Ornithodoros turicata TaxID=34597 RepID=UPI003139B0A4
MNSKPLLYGFDKGATWRVRIALELKNVDYEYRTVNLLGPKGEEEQFSEEFGRLNPIRQVPVLVVDGHGISQSASILEYLEEAYPSPRMMPADAFARAKVREIVGIIVADTHPKQGLSMIKYLGEQHWNDSSKEAITKSFTALEAVLKETSGKYCVGDEITLADVCLVPQAFNASTRFIDVASFPTVNRVYVSLNQVPAVKRAEQLCMNDMPEDEGAYIRYMISHFSTAYPHLRRWFAPE